MKIAITTEGNQVFQHFGKCPVFTVVTVEDGEVRGETSLDASQNGHAALTGFLKSAGVETIICGGIGDGAKQMLSSAGIRLISGISGSIDDAVNAYLAGDLSDQGGACRHEEHEQGHVCSCGNHCK
jgi:predicted Fe-Mo cluster-binding NifX family protein